jgi:S-adenosylmethionine hydrolase
VVDPTVGSGRRGVILWTEGAVFVAPDNGVLSMVYQREEVRRVLSIEAEHYFRKPVSATFHGRDVFGPVAGWIAHGTDVDNFGPEITDFVRFAMPSPKLTADKRVEGVVLHVDKFGNVITNITVGDLCRLLHRDPEPVAFRINGREIRRHCSYYSEVQGDELFSLLGSSGYYEIAAFRKPAARLLEARRGMRVELEVR